MKLMNQWFAIGIVALWAVNGLAQPANNNAGPYAASPQQIEARDLTGKRGEQQVDLFTGSFGYSIPIACAPARNGSEPALALTYSSGGDNGWCGMGWKLDIGGIERNTKDGFPIQFSGANPPAPGTAYDDSKGFLLNLFGKSAKLFAVATNGSTIEYRAETDTDFLRCFLDKTGNKWTVYDKSGTAYYFGQGASSQVANPKWSSGYSSTFQWALDQIDTATGDRTTIGYTTYTSPDTGLAERTIYPTTITYNGYGTSYTGVNTISFGTEIRPDRRSSYRWGFRTEQTRRLTNIVCQVGSQKVWRYAIGYTTSTATKRSLLSSVTTYGSDDSTTLPAQTFTYQQHTNGMSFGPAIAWTNMNLADLSAGGTDPYVTQVNAYGTTVADLLDIDGDGLPDRVTWATTGQDTYQVQHNTGSGFGTRYTFGPTSSGTSTTASDANPIPDDGFWSALNDGYARIRDLNGDGLPDRVADYWKHFDPIVYATTPYTNFAVMLNTGTNFGTAFQWPVATNKLGTDPNAIYSTIESGGAYVGLFDINGDGLPDRVIALYGEGPEINFKVQFNTGTNFTPVKLFGPYRSQNYTNSDSTLYWSGIHSDDAQMLDMNGDGLPDRLMLPMNPSSPGNAMIYGNPSFNFFAVEYNDGYAFESTNSNTSNAGGSADRWNGVILQSTGGGYRYDLLQNPPVVGLYDLNGDGLPDRVMLDETAFGQGKAQWLVYLNNGRGFDTTAIKVPVDAQGQTSSREWCGLSWSYGYSVATTLMDMNGDGLLDRVMKVYDNGNGYADTYSNFCLVQLNSAPVPDLLTNINNGLGGSFAVTYKSSSAYDNRKDPSVANSGSTCPYPMQTVASVTEFDGINPARTTSYGYTGGFYDGVRREFHGFAVVTVTNPPSPIAATYNRRTVNYFHQGGGQSRTNLGEYLDPGNFAKEGMAYRVETYGNDNNLYHVTVNQVNQSSLGNGRFFPFTQLSVDCDYPSGSTSTPKMTASQFVYDPATGNLTNKIEYGEVTGFNPTNTGSFSFTDATSTDTRYFNTHYTAIGSYILDHPDNASLKDGGGSVVRETRFTYNSTGGTLKTKEARITSGYYATNSFGYNSYGLVSSSTDPVGVQTAITYDSTYNTYPATTTAGSFTTTTTYDARSGLLTSSKSPTGVTVTNIYDALFRPTESDRIPVGGGSATWLKTFSYPASLKAIVSGVATNYAETTVNDGVGGLTSRSYIDGFGRAIQSRTLGENGNYRVVSACYDERGEVFLTTWPSFDSVITFKKPSGSPTAEWIGFDAAGRTATNRLVTVSFDANGAFSSKANLAGDTGSALGEKTWSYVYTNNPWWLICTDEDGKVRRYQLDAFGRTNQIQEVDGASTYTTTLKYDLADNLTNIVNANSENIYYAFDNAGGLVAMADPYLGQWTYQRDSAGRLRVQTDGRGDVIKLFYTSSGGTQDPLGRIQRKEIYSTNYSDHVLTPVFTNTYVYDSSDDGNFTVYPGQLYEVTDSEGWQKSGYDTRARQVKTVRHLNIINRDYTNSYTLNDGDRVTSIVYPGGGPTITNTYFNGGSIKTVSRVGGSAYYTATAANIDEFGRVTSFQYGNTLTTTRSFYANSKRLSGITCGTVFSRTLTYSAGDDLLSLAGTGISGTMNVTYDNLHRIKTYSGLSGSYGYDSVGNISNNIEGGGSSYGYGIRRPEAVKVAFGGTNLYDLCGNMIVRHAGTTNSQSLVYDAENHLTRVAQTSTNFMLAKFGYAADGARLWKWNNQNSTNLQVWIGNIYEEKGGKTLFHVYAGGQQVCTFESGSPLAGGSDTNKVGYYYHQDQLTSSSVLSDSSAHQTEVNAWYPFGRVQTNSPQASFKVSRQFTGQIKDDETGLYYYNARYYDPELGRFIQADTEIPDIGNPQSYNRYSYCVNNPLRYTDPTGHGFWQNHNPALLWDKEVYEGIGYAILGKTSVRQDPSSYQALMAKSGTPLLTGLTDENGNRLGNPAAAVVTAGGGALLTAATYMTPAGEEKALLSAGEQLWKLSAIERGIAIENRLAATEYKGWFRVGQLKNGKFPLVDFQKGNNLVSLKTVNTKASGWLEKMQAHIKDLSNGLQVNGKAANVTLDLRVQSGGAQAAKDLVSFGEKYNVNVIVKEFK